MDNREFGQIIMQLIEKKNLTRQVAKQAFEATIKNQVTEMQQGAFLAALTSKGETEEEIAGAWEAIYELDTQKVDLSDLGAVVENSGTGMDGFKTFNISTAASIVAAAASVPMARHGARAITSVCGTVDIAEELGVDVECPVEVVAKSVRHAGIGLFNGMSPAVHPSALARILSKICFGSTLNIAASLANPAFPRHGVRGVYSKEMVLPVARIMKAIGYERALVIYGELDGLGLGMDEASICGTTYCAELVPSGDIKEYKIRPEQFNLSSHSPEELVPSKDIKKEAKEFVGLIKGNGTEARTGAVLLNAALAIYIGNRAVDIKEGLKKAMEALNSGAAYNTLEKWVASQNTDPARGLEKLSQYS